MSTTHRPSPPADMPVEAADLWVTLVDSLDANFFTQGDLPLLNALVTATIQKRACDALVALHGPILPDGSVNNAVKLSIQLSASMAALSSKLRLCKSSRVRAESAGLRKSLDGLRPWEVTDETAEFFQ